MWVRSLASDAVQLLMPAAVVVSDVVRLQIPAPVVAEGRRDSVVSRHRGAVSALRAVSLYHTVNSAAATAGVNAAEECRVLHSGRTSTSMARAGLTIRGAPYQHKVGALF